MLQFMGTVALSFLSGVFTVVFAILYFVYKYRDDLFQRDKRPNVEYEKNQLGKLLRHNLHNGRGISTLGEKESCGFVNVLFAFIFREWRDTNQLQKWVLKKVNIEFMEFMETKTASRLLNGLKIHDISLGTNFPVFHSAKIKEPFSFMDDELPETVVLEVDMEYLGGFYLAIDVDLVFGKTAFLAVRITYVKGRVRLHFGRQPCTHWSLCFIDEPDIKFEVETSFETRQLPQLTSLIVNQIRRTIKRKHTFPQYKMRYNPFFSFQHPESSPFDGFIAEIPVQPATLEVFVAAATRLLISPKGEKERNADSPNYIIFATLSVNVESCVGKAVMNLIIPAKNAENSEIANQQDVPTTSKSPQGNQTKSQSTTIESIQRSLFGAKKDTKSDAMKKSTQQSTSTPKLPIKEPEPTAEYENDTARLGRTDSISSTSSTSSGPTYVMVALNFGATLREETRGNGQKLVVVENITEHNVHGQSGMKDGDTVVELNGIPITSLSQAIATIEQIRAKRESFKFKVRRTRQDPDSIDPGQNGNASNDSDKSNTSLDTESDHSDVESEDYKDFVNISLQVAELQNMKDGSRDRQRASSTSTRDQAGPSEDLTRPHSRSLTASNDPSVDAPYMTLVSSPTPTTSTQSLKDAGTSSDNPDIPQKIPEVTQRKVEKESVKKKLDKIISPRSRSESPTFFRKSSPKKSTPKKNAQNGPLKAESIKKEFPSKRSSSPTPPRLFDSLFSEASDSSKARIIKSPEPDRSAPPKTVENLSYARVDNDPESQLYKTSFVNSNQRELSWNQEKFTFNLKERHRYLNVRYWTQQIGKQGVVRNKPQIVGCVSVPLCEIEMYCRGVTSRRVTRRFPLFAPNELPHDHKWFLNDPASHRPSFREQYCYGDTTLTIKLIPNQANKNNSSNCLNNLDSAGTYFPDDETNGSITKEILSNLSEKTGSDYLLSAATPKGRKLLVSRQTQTSDKKPSSPPKSKAANDCAPISENADELSPETHEGDPKVQEKVSLTQMLKGFLHGGKSPQDTKKQPQLEEEPLISEDLSTENKPGDDVTVGIITSRKTGLHQFELVKFSKATKCSQCHSKLWMKTGLQCTICHEICHKRCVEKFKKDQTCAALEEASETSEPKNAENFVVLNSASETEGGTNTSDSDGVPTAALSLRNKILDMTTSPGDETDSSPKINSRQKNYMRSKNSEDLLAVNAKEMGRDLHRDLPLSERKQMLERQTQRVENELHSEIAEKEHLLDEQKSCENTSSEYRRLKKKILKSDERLQALTLLLLHYRAGLEDCEYDSTAEGMILSDDEDEKYGAVGSKTIASAQQ